MATAVPASFLSAAAVSSGSSDESDTRDSADESDNEADEAPVGSGAARRKRYRRTASMGQKDADACNPSWKTPVRRRILRKDRRATLEMLTSDDDVNSYQEARPSSYREPVARRTLHETSKHLKSSFETLYNPELNRQQATGPGLLTSSSSESLASDAANTLATDTWQLASGPKLSSPYLDVSRPALDSRMTPEQAERRGDGFQQDGRAHEGTSGEIWTEFGGHSPAVLDGQWKASESRNSQPVNLSIRMSKPSLQVSTDAPTHSNGSFGVNVEVELSRSAVPAVGPELPVSEPLIGSFKQQGLLTALKPAPLVPDKPKTATLTRSRRVLPAVPDSADLEVSDLLRRDAPSEAASADFSGRPKSAVEILVPRGRCSSIQQLPSSATVSQQLRSLFHNPSPHIMLHRAPTQQTQPQPPRKPIAEHDVSAELNKARQKYMPLRASHVIHQPPQAQPQPAHPHGNGRQSAVEMLMSRQQPTSRSLASTPQQPQQMPRSQKQWTPQPSQGSRQEANSHYDATPKQASSNILEHYNSRSSSSSAVHGAIHHEPYKASPQGYSHQRHASPAPVAPHDRPRHEQTAYKALFESPHLPSRAAQVQPHKAQPKAVSQTARYSPQIAQTPTQAPPLPPRRAKQQFLDHQVPSPHQLSRAQSAVEQQIYNRVQPAPKPLLSTYQLRAPPPPDDAGGSGEDDSGCGQSSGEYLLASEPTRPAAESPANPTRIQTNPRSGRTATTLEPKRSQLPSGPHLPPNAVRVLPRMDNVEVGELQRVLALRRERAATAAAMKSGEGAKDAIEGLEQMCRDMRLHDDQLLDGAERRDTAIRVQARMESLRTPQSRSAATDEQQSGHYSHDRTASDQVQQLAADPSCRHRQTAIVTSKMTRPESATRRRDPLNTSLQPPNQRHHRAGQDRVLLLPGEQESGPEIIL
ncbi:hypothetical protein BOX15_Mlig000447g3 [Macrostomum lignano]|uniref:Uncharacterized protein n=1 Tax=Macrostomum lignano TaxID=282301 RepID=A0A267GJ53_9PLAT|nr:hypothetical protein BOX15_Mlig000447g3 [Macrostomum lignano]